MVSVFFLYHRTNPHPPCCLKIRWRVTGTFFFIWMPFCNLSDSTSRLYVSFKGKKILQQTDYDAILFHLVLLHTVALKVPSLRCGENTRNLLGKLAFILYYILIRCRGRWIRDGAATVPVLHLKHVLKKRDQKNTSAGKAWTWSSPKKHRDLGNFPAFKPDLLRMKLVMALWISYFLSIFQI